MTTAVFPQQGQKERAGGSAQLGRVWICAGALVAGTLAAYAGFGATAGVVAVAVSGCALWWRRRAGTRLVALTIFVFGLGAVSAASRSTPAPILESLARDVAGCRLQGRVLEQAGGLGVLVAVDRADCEGFGRVVDAGIVAAEASSADPGARIRAVGWLVPLRDDSFDRALWRLGARASFVTAQIEVGEVEGALQVGAANVRESLRSATEDMNPDEGALLRGLTIGDTSDMSASLESDLRNAGLSHLVAVSGSNVAIVLAVVMGLVRGSRPLTRLAVGICGLVIFVAVVGPEPSVLRAAVMGGIALTAIVGGRRAEPLNALALALIAVIIVRPALVFSVGLQLSAAATAGIVLWTEFLELRLRALPGLVRVPLAVTIAAQFAVAPILVLTFGELSLVALPANLLCAPVVAPVTIAGFFAAVAGLAAPAVARVSAHLASPLVAWIIGVGHRLGGQDWAAAAVPRMLGWPLLALVAAAAFARIRAGTRPLSD